MMLSPLALNDGPPHRAAPKPLPGGAMKVQRPRPAVSVQYVAIGDDLPARPLLRRWVRAALGGHVAHATIVLRFVDEAESRTLNRRYRERDRPTNVLAFVYDDERGADAQLLRGDIVLCAPVLRTEAARQGKLLAAHCAHLVVHGMLHLQGYEHDRAAGAAQMEAREIDILARLGFGNPYVMEPGLGTKSSRRGG